MAAKSTVVKRPVGRPKVKVSEKIKEEIFWLVGEGHSLRDICKRTHIPCRQQIQNLRIEDEKFNARFTRAVQLQAEGYAEQMVELSKTMVNRALKGTITPHLAQAVRTHLETMKWITSVLHPKMFGAKAIAEYNPAQGKKALLITFDGVDDDE